MGDEGGAGPPPFTRFLFKVLLRGAGEETIWGDVEEAFERRARERGLEYARRWYRRQALGSVWALWMARLRPHRNDRLRTGPLGPQVWGDRGNREGRMQHVAQDLWYAVRQLKRRPGFGLATVLVLALGIGANTAVFSVLDGVLLRALPLPHADRLVRVLSDVPSFGLSNASLSEFQDWERERGPFESLGAFYATVHSLTGGGMPEQITVGSTTGDLFGTAGLTASLGRTYGAANGAYGIAPSESVILLTDDFWRRSFGADPSLVGQTVELDGRSVRVLGVLPPEEEVLRFGRSIDAWAPMGEPLPWMAGSGFLTVLGRLQPELSPETAQEPLRALAAGLIGAGRTENGIAMVPLRDGVVGSARSLLWALQGAALLLLLVVATNAANLLLARSLDRTGEFAVRTALGASRGRIARQVLVETALLGLLGGVAGLGVALLGRDIVLRMVPDMAALAGPATLSWSVLAYTLGTSLGVGLLAGLWPAIRATSRSWSTMKDGVGRGVGGAYRGRRAMVAVEVGLTLVLLVSAGLMVRTVSSLLDEELGFEPGGVLTARITLPETRYPEWPQRHRFFEELVERVGALPGVEAVGLTGALPLTGGDFGTFQIEGQEWEDERGPSIGKKSASPGYFSALGIPVLAGRAFTLQDRLDAPLVAVISESMARRFFPNDDPLGKRVRIYWWDDEFTEIVGVVGDVKQSGWDQGAELAAYRPQAQIGAPDAVIVIKTTRDPYDLTLPVRSAVLDVDPDQPIYGVTTLDDLVGASLKRRTALTSLLVGLSIIALVISCLGVYAVTSQAVRGRSREIGIRIALGASGPNVLRSVILTESRVIAAGILLGLGGAAATTRALDSLLFGVTRLDALTLIVSVSTLGGVALIAALVPARRATRIDPAGSLQSD